MSTQQEPNRTYPTEDALRAEAVRLARHACNGEHGRTYGDLLFEAVTEGRQKWQGYSACGDLPMWMLRELGFRDERLLNRNDDGGVVPWQIGQNLSKLVFNPLGAFVWATGTKRPKPGDVLYVSKPEHVCILESLNEPAGTIITLDYGQWDYKVMKPAGRRLTRRFVVSGRTLQVGTRTLHGWLDLARLPGLIAPEAAEPELCPTCPYAHLRA
jgi:hypothetical protein